MRKRGRRFAPVFRLVIHSRERLLAAYEMHCAYPRDGAFVVDVDRIAHRIAREWAQTHFLRQPALAA